MKYRIIKITKSNGFIFYTAEFLDNFFFIKFWNDVVNHDDYRKHRGGWSNKIEFDSEEEADNAIKWLQFNINLKGTIISEEVVKEY